jgi:hypothetical protein
MDHLAGVILSQGRKKCRKRRVVECAFFHPNKLNSISEIAPMNSGRLEKNFEPRERGKLAKHTHNK